MNTELSPKTNEMLSNYLALPIGNKTSVPYFNNRRAKVRFGLRALVGKGTPLDIANEARIIGLREKKKVQNLTSEDLKKFLVDHGLGIDCSGLVYHLLDTECHEKGLGKLSRYIKVTGDITRHLAKIIRPAESIGVATISNEMNSHEIKRADVRAGDFISVLGAGGDHTYNHIFLITKTENNIVSYAHSYARPSDGRYNHGVRLGFIRIEDNQKIADAIWHEESFDGVGKDLFAILSEARFVAFRRLNAFK
jgi:hypothetical protein